jgi:hypothetical protein
MLIYDIEQNILAVENTISQHAKRIEDITSPPNKRIYLLYNTQQAHIPTEYICVEDITSPHTNRIYLL